MQPALPIAADIATVAETQPGTPPGAIAMLPASRGRGTYGEILRSTILIGGSSILNVAIGIVRTKAMAVLLGPAGFGLMGMYSSLADLARSVAEMGINSSGVRQIAESAGSGNADRIARTVIVLRRLAVVLGALGALLLVLFARPLSAMTFGTDARADAVALLSVAVFLRLISDSQCALIQGLRRISDLARIAVFGSLFGTLASIPLVYYLREDGVVPALVAVAAATAATSWWYSRKVPIAACAVSAGEVKHEAMSLLQLGLAFMGSGLLMMGAAYAVRLIVLREAGLGSAGFYQAAWTLGGLYVSFVLQAMGADFYPRLVGAIEDAGEANRLVNEQAQVSLLLAGPGVIATLTFAPLIVTLFYSHEFAAAVDVLRWVCLGMALRVVSWPMGYIIVAKNQKTLFFGAELAWAVVNVGLSWCFVQTFALEGAGMAFFGSYVFHGVMVYLLSRHLTRFSWSASNLKLGAAFLLSIGLVFCAFSWLPPLWAAVVGSVVLVMSSAHSIRALLGIVSREQLPPAVQKLLILLRFLHLA